MKMQSKSQKSFRWKFGVVILCCAIAIATASRSAMAQQNTDSPILLPQAIPGDSRPVMIIGGIESTDRRIEPRAEGTQRPEAAQPPEGLGRPEGVGLQADRPQTRRGNPPVRRPGDGRLSHSRPDDNRPDDNRADDNRAEINRPGDSRPGDSHGQPGFPGRFSGPHGFPAPQDAPGQHSAPGQQSGVGPHGQFVPPGAMPAQSFLFSPVGMPVDYDQMMQSPMFQKMLALMQENMELKAHMKIQSIQTESKHRERELENKVDELRRQLEASKVELKETMVSKERLEKRISELEHRSRLLDERAKAIGNQTSQQFDEDFLKRFAADMRRQFDERLVRSRENSKVDDLRKDDEREPRERSHKADSSKEQEQNDTKKNRASHEDGDEVGYEDRNEDAE